MPSRLTNCLLSLLMMASPLAAGERAPSDTDGFRLQVAPLLTKYCSDCHSGADAEAGLSLANLNPDLLGGGDEETWRMIDEQIRFGDMPPPDAPQPSGAERSVMRNWIRQELLKSQWPGAATDEKRLLPQFGNYVDHQFLFGERLPRVVPARPRLWRLRPEIYDSTMPRLAERVSGLANGLNELDGSEFKDYASSYFLDEAAASPLLGNAKIIAERMLGPQSKDRVFKALVSDDEPPGEDAVIAAIDTAFRKVLGRAPTDEETNRFLAFYQKTSQIGGRPSAAKALLTAVLLQPEVLYRQELGNGPPDEFGRVRLSQPEIAYALSYAFANEPLREFLEAAAAGELESREQIARLVRERLQDDSLLQEKNPRVMQFFREYFNYPFANEVFKDNPEGGSHEPGLLIADLETTLCDILRADQRVLAEMLTTSRYYVNAHYKKVKNNGVLLQMADARRKNYPTAYGLPLDWKWSLDRQPIPFRADERAGVLTHPAWLAAWSGNFDNHPVQRGKWVRTHLLGGTVPDVPIGVDARVPEQEHTTFRDRLGMATRKAECWRCHKKMDPLGLTFERYDHYGRFQRLDAGRPVDASGLISRTGVKELDGRQVSGPTQMMQILAESEYVEQVFVRHVFRYFLGRNETLGDANTLQDAHRAYRESDGSFRELVVSILSSDSFLLRQTAGASQ
ncbi:DUF1588 domain-containing protein [Lignipirellula cremea]|uniref:Planctomycete cytochrome C n=1 Tax=Lignipirellula cremea TaxID=2528010 RepID=A0A518DL06_9BACT|nr:DUF1588 domain-containing protein [Lignipirellula cremea]QDU92522.1 hypothetical protein Pla8534_02700 [Lignipirellula cremea]